MKVRKHTDDGEKIHDQPKLSSNDRYFVVKERPKCYNCHQLNHKSSRCPFELLNCEFCLTQHDAYNCPSKVVCTVCGSFEHNISVCQFSKKDRCIRCFKVHHKEVECRFVRMWKEVVDYYHHGKVMCLNCGQRGHPNCQAKFFANTYINDGILDDKLFRFKDSTLLPSLKNSDQDAEIVGIPSWFERVIDLKNSNKTQTAHENQTRPFQDQAHVNGHKTHLCDEFGKQYFIENEESHTKRKFKRHQIPTHFVHSLNSQHKNHVNNRELNEDEVNKKHDLPLKHRLKDQKKGYEIKPFVKEIDKSFKVLSSHNQSDTEVPIQR